MLTERVAALFDTLELQAQRGLDETARLRGRLAVLEAENQRLRDTLEQREAALAQAAAVPQAVPRSAAERGYPLPRRAEPEAPLPAEPEAPVAESASPPGNDTTAVSSEPAFSHAADKGQAENSQTNSLPDDEPPTPQALLDQWYRRYTDTFFKGHTRPLKVGVHEDLVAREPWPDKLVRRALACYVHLPRYLKAVRVGAERVDLDGQPAGVVTEGEARHAHKQLESLQAQQRQREAASKRNPESRKNARLDNKLSELLAKHGRH
ncbi:ProP effector [Modicisalibacter ilicicola DSM 19980]|uniref:ProP effector n=1 Tax=Modicisalibacter ilicicola DSM 19980 TaxID=1121942 RepID=A0A1M4ST01_9GAMM|nr:ProQ/FINO family protein [Halomonas ilicicola]SHE35137.1 ProP effector [Halomonas ilicicola DSM 19980]